MKNSKNRNQINENRSTLAATNLAQGFKEFEDLANELVALEKKIRDKAEELKITPYKIILVQDEN